MCRRDPGVFSGVFWHLPQRVTGHRTVEVVLKHYFRPGREDFKQRILSAMPRLLTGLSEAGTIDVEAEEVPEYVQNGSPSEELSEAQASLKGVTGKANRERVSRAAELIEKAKDWYDGHVLREPEVARA